MINKENTLIVITARLNSSRLKRKPLIKVNALPLVQHVINECILLKGFKDIILTSESDELLNSITTNIKKIKTSSKHNSGSERMSEVAKIYEASAYLSVPCDIWNISKNAINDFAEDMIKHEAIYGTFLNPLNNKDELYDPSIVKAIHDNQNIALWFSRLPFMQNATISDDIFKNVKKQIGLYWYSKEAILKFYVSPMTACEKAEMNESLRILENGDKMYCHTSKTIIESINAEDDLLKLKNNWKCFIEYKSVQGNNL